MRAHLLPLLLVLAGCPSGDDDVNHLPDGPPHSGDGGGSDDGAPPLTLCGAPISTTAPDTVMISGTVSDGAIGGGGGGNALSGVAVSVERAGSVLGSGTTDGGGTFQVVATTGGQAIDGYVELENTGYRSLRYFPPAPFTSAKSTPRLVMLDDQTADVLAGAFGVTQDPAKGIAIVKLSDCSGAGIEGAVVTVAPAGTSSVKYVDMNGGQAGSTTTSTGFAVAFNVDAGTVVIGATKAGKEFREHAISSGPSWIAHVAVGER